MKERKKYLKPISLITLFLFLFQLILTTQIKTANAETNDIRVEGVRIKDIPTLIANSFGGSNGEEFKSVAVTGDGGYVVVGHSSSNDNVMEGLNKGYNDAIIVKYDGQGNIEWNKSFGGSDYDGFDSIAVTGDGGYIAVGYSQSKDKDMEGLYKGKCDAIIVKYDREGNVEWKKSFGGSDYDEFKSVAVTRDGGYIVAGISSSNDKDMEGLYKGGMYSSDAIIVKYDREGNVEWKKSFGGSYGDGFNSIAVTGDGGYIAAGFAASINGNMEGLNKGWGDAIIVKYDREGNVEWKKSFGGSYGDYFNSVAVTRDGGYIAVGYSQSKDKDMIGLYKGNTDYPNIIIEDAIIVKYDREGNIEWKKSFGGSDYDEFKSVAVTRDGGYIVAGISSSNDKDMEGLYKSYYNFQDAIIVKYNREGNVEWKKSFGGSYGDYFNSVAVTGDRGYIAVGHSSSNDKDMEWLNKSYDAIIDGTIYDAIIIRIYENTKIVKLGEQLSLQVEIEPFNASDKRVIWSSNNEAVANVDATGKVTATGVGSATITVKTVDGGHEATCEVTVEPIRVSGIILREISKTVKIGESFSLVATVTPTNATNKGVTWSSSNETVAKVDATGKVTTVGIGTAIITVKTLDGGYTAKCIVTVNPIKVTGVKLNITNKSVYKGESFSLVATVLPTNATNKGVVWSSSNTKVATVDKNGKVTAVGVGSATITVKTADGGYIAKCTVTVKPIKVTGVKLNKTSLTLKKGSKYKLIATIGPTNATNKNVKWSSSNAKAVKVDANGNIVAVGKGTATITVKTVDGGYKATCKVVVK